MKNILIATDFTPAARSAEPYAVALAKALDCGLTVFAGVYWIMKPPCWMSAAYKASPCWRGKGRA